MTGPPHISQGQTPTTSTSAPLNTFQIRDHDWFMIHDWIDALPMPSRVFQAIGFFLFGISAQAAFEWRKAETKDDIHDYRLMTVLFVIAALAFLICDWKLSREQGRSARFISEHMDQADAGLAVTRPVRATPAVHWWKAWRN